MSDWSSIYLQGYPPKRSALITDGYGARGGGDGDVGGDDGADNAGDSDGADAGQRLPGRTSGLRRSALGEPHLPRAEPPEGLPSRYRPGRK
jgi:hypothetical protein